jgi:lysophospholipase L1-like esterase
MVMHISGPPWVVDIPAGNALALTAAQVQAVQAMAATPAFSGANPQRVFMLGDSLLMRSFRAIASASATVLSPATDVEIALGTGATLPPIGSYVRIINQTDQALNIDVPVVGSGTNSTIVRFPFSVSGRISATVNGATYNATNDTGWWNYAEAELAALGKPVQVVRNAGDGGDNLAKVRARISTEIAPYAAPGDVVVLMAGVNGASGSDSSLDVATPAALIEQMGGVIDDLLVLGVTVCVSTITQAQASGYWATSAATALSNTTALNGYIRGRAMADARVHVVDSHAALGGGDYASGDVESAGIHLLPSGAEKVGQRFVDDCGALFTKRTFRRVLSVQDEYVDASSWNLVTNVDFAGATGSTKPDDWTVASAGGGTKTYTLSARADGIGNDLLIEHAHTAATGTILTHDITSRVAAGQRLAFGIEYETITAPAQGHYCADVAGVRSRRRDLRLLHQQQPLQLRARR